MSQKRCRNRSFRAVLAALAGLAVCLPTTTARAEQATKPAPPPATAADAIADVFSKVGDRVYEDCIFELSDEQLEVQAALVEAYMEKGASGPAARKLAAAQIEPPKLSKKCEDIRNPREASPSSWVTTLAVPKVPAPEITPKEKPASREKPAPAQPPPAVTLKGKTILAHWDCAPGVDYVTVRLNGYERKLTGGEICNPYEDVVREVPASVPAFRLGYTIRTGRLFVISSDPQTDGQTIAWAISGRDICRNNPDPDCLAARAVGPLPPGEYTFAAEKSQRINWGPRTKRYVAGVYLKKLWNKDRFTRAQTAAILARGNIAIHARLKGEMSEACIGLEPKGWSYVASLIKEGRATGLDVYIDEPHPKVAENPPVVVASTFSFTSLFK